METISIISYFIKVSAITFVVFVLWYILLRNVNRFSLVRFFLIGGLITSAFMPIVIPFLQSLSIVPESNIGIDKSFTLPAVIINSSKVGIKWGSIFAIIYTLVSSLFALRLIIQILKIYNLAKEGTCKKIDGIWIVDHARDISPFSFMNYCFINPSQIPTDKLKGIIIHERAHYSKMHSIDILLVEIIGIMQWFNPFYWIIRKTIVEVHEYQADNTAIKSKIDPHAYLDTIVSIAFNGIALPIGNNLNKSLTLKRLAMITISKKSKGAIIKFAIAMFISLPIISTISCDKTSDSQTVKEEIIELQSPPPPPVEYEGEIFVIVEDMPLFEGGKSEKFREYIAQNLKYPEEAVENGLDGTVYISFIVETDGVVSNVKVIRGVAPVLDNEAIRVVESSPKWTPGKQRGEKVRTTFTFPIIFKLQ
jgi:TonB family protein